VPSQIAKLGEWYIFDTAQAVTKQSPNGCVPSHALASANSQSVYPADRQLADFISALAEEIIESRFPWKHVHWLWGDEGFPHDDPDSNYRMAYDALFSRAPPRFSCDRGTREKF
jgi:hypothetical protein